METMPWAHALGDIHISTRGQWLAQHIHIQTPLPVELIGQTGAVLRRDKAVVEKVLTLTRTLGEDP